MLYRTLTRLIEKKMTDGLREKIDVFYASGSLNRDEYEELIAMMEA